jgi:hypothetical protein
LCSSSACQRLRLARAPSPCACAADRHCMVFHWLCIRYIVPYDGRGERHEPPGGRCKCGRCLRADSPTPWSTRRASRCLCAANSFAFTSADSPSPWSFLPRRTAGRSGSGSRPCGQSAVKWWSNSGQTVYRAPRGCSGSGSRLRGPKGCQVVI